MNNIFKYLEYSASRHLWKFMTGASGMWESNQS